MIMRKVNIKYATSLFTVLMFTMFIINGCNDKTEEEYIEYNIEQRENEVKELLGENWQETVPYMTMTFTGGGLILGGSGMVIINWGDGAPNTHVTLSGGIYGEVFRHNYLKDTRHTITVIGDNTTYLNRSGLTSLDVSKNPALEKLECINGWLSSLDLGRNPALTYLDAKNNNISNLDLSNNRELKFLAVYQNELKSLDLSNNVALTRLECGYNNPLSNIDLSNNIALEYLDITNFPQDFKAKWGKLDVSNNPALKILYCSNQGLSELNLSNNLALTTLDCSLNYITNLDLSNNRALLGLACDSNRLTSLNLSNNSVLTGLHCSSNRLLSLDLSNNTALSWLTCDSNSLANLDLSNNTVLNILSCNSNKLTSLDLSNNSKLGSLYCTNNNFQADALNALFRSLSIVKYGCIRIANNPGITGAGFNQSIAEKKGWKFEYPPYSLC